MLYLRLISLNNQWVSVTKLCEYNGFFLYFKQTDNNVKHCMLYVNILVVYDSKYSIKTSLLHYRGD